MKATRSICRYMGFLFILAFAAMPICSVAISKIYEVFLPIDASRSGASASAEVEITEARLYIFYLGFHYKDEGERKRLAPLVGDGGRLHTGEYANPGVVQPANLKLTAATGNASIDVDRTIQGIAAHELGANLSGAYDRMIYASILPPGRYHMKITILQGRREFEGFESAVSVGVRPGR